jgi:hypothetical protein
MIPVSAEIPVKIPGKFDGMIFEAGPAENVQVFSEESRRGTRSSEIRKPSR